MYSYISHTVLKKGECILIGDPGVCRLHDMILSFHEINKSSVLIKDMPEGGYYSYHISTDGMPSFADELLFLKDILSPEDLTSVDVIEVGSVCAAFTGTVFLCEQTKAFNAKYSYYTLESDALYYTKDIADVLSNKKVLTSTEHDLLELCLSRKNDIYLTGKEIADITDISVVPEFLRDILSTHWSTDIARSLSDKPAVSIIGGVASNSGYGMLKVYMLMKKKQIVGIRLLLDAEDVENEDALSEDF